MGYFVRPETTILTLADGATLTVRRRLSAGEARARLQRWTIADPNTGDLRPDYARLGLATISAYLLDWTLTDDAGRLVDIRGAAVGDLETIIDNLEGDAFVMVREAIEKHEAAMIAERLEQKKTVGPNASQPISTSPGAVAGDTNG
jgi:hypothetical protein